MSSLESPGGSRSSLRLSPAKERKRGSGELVEFCADSVQGSKQYVRQEPAQDPCGHDLLAPLVQTPACEGSSPQPERSAPSASTVLLDPPCPSPQLDGLAAVSSNSSYACSAGGGSQPGSAASHSSQGSINRASGFPPVGLAADKDSSRSAAGSPLQPFRETPNAAQLAAPGVGPEKLPAALPLYPSAPHIFRGSSDPLSTRRSAAHAPGMPKLAVGLPGSIPTSQQLPGQQQQQLKSGWGRQAGVGLQPLEVPDDDGVMIGASRSTVDETEFITPVSLCLTPIRTRARARRESQEAEEPSPVVYVERLAPPQDSCFPKVLPSMRATINILASSTSAARIAPPPGAYNPYERLTLGGGGGYQCGGGGGYQGGSSYGFSYGGAPSGPPTTSSSYWASHRQDRSQQEKSQQRGAAAAQAAAMAAAAAAEDGWWGRPAATTSTGPQARAHGARGSTPVGGADEEEVEHIVMVPGGIRRKPSQQQQQLEEENEVEHIVMVPGVRRRAPAGQLPAPAEQPALGAAAEPADDMGAPTMGLPVEATADLVPAAEVGCARPAAAAAKAVNAVSSMAAALAPLKTEQGTLEPATESMACDQGSHKLLIQVFKALMLAGMAFAAAATSQESR